MSETQPDWFTNLVAQLKQDKRKTMILAVLAVVGLIMGAKALLGGKASAAKAQAAVASVLSTSEEITRTQAQSSSPQGSEARRQKYIEGIDRRITRDLFAARLDVFPAVEPVPTPVQPKVATTEPAVEVDPAELQRQAILNESRSLVLVSILEGDSSAVIINDRLLKVGERINDFEVVEISADSCQVRQKDVTVTLVLKQ